MEDPIKEFEQRAKEQENARIDRMLDFSDMMEQESIKAKEESKKRLGSILFVALFTAIYGWWRLK